LRFFINDFELDSPHSEDLKEIAYAYLKGGFFFDFITTVPFIRFLDGKFESTLVIALMSHSIGEESVQYIKINTAILYFFKVLRLKKGYFLLNTNKFKKKIHDIFHKERISKLNLQQSKKKLKTSNKQICEFEEPSIIDNSKITQQQIIIYFFRILKLIIVIFNTSFFVGIAWYIMCSIYSLFQFSSLTDYKHIVGI